MEGPILMIDHRTATFSSGDVEISYRLFGKPGDTPIVIVHGLSYFSYDWIPMAAVLAADRQVAAMDMRGFGDSGWAQDYSVPAFAGDIIGLLDHLGWARAILVGHSMGGRNCTYCAAEYPDRITGLVLVDWSPENAAAGAKRVTETVASTPDSFASVEEAMRFFKVDPASPQGVQQRPRFEAYLKPVGGGYAIKRDPHFRNQFRRVLETGEKPKLGVDMWAALGKVACPVLVMRGARSDMFAAETVEKVRAANPRIQIVEMDTGHDVAGTDPAAFEREALAFFHRQRSEVQHA
jgi:pimeloyl-ACP methyl ester carboxylesterase